MRRQKRVSLHSKLIAPNQAQTGYVLAEAGPALWLIFVGILFPLLVLATLTFRFGLFWAAAGQAAQYACGAQVVSPSSGSTQPPVVPAVTLASTTANSVLNMFPGSVTLV